MPNTKLEISQFFRRIFRSISRFFSNIVASCKHNCCCCYKHRYQDLFNSDDEYDEYDYKHGFINPIYTLENNFENSYHNEKNNKAVSIDNVDDIYNVSFDFSNDDIL